MAEQVRTTTPRHLAAAADPPALAHASPPLQVMPNHESTAVADSGWVLAPCALRAVPATCRACPTHAQPAALQEVLPKAGLVVSEKGNLAEILCKPKIMPLKSITLQKLEEMEVGWGRGGTRWAGRTHPTTCLMAGVLMTLTHLSASLLPSSPPWLCDPQAKIAELSKQNQPAVSNSGADRPRTSSSSSAF